MPDPSPPPWRVEPLAEGHDRGPFSCGKPGLDEFLRLYALQNQRKGVGRTFVAVRPGEAIVRGYYTLSSGSVAFARLPPERRKGLPRYPVPVVHMGRLAVAQDFQGQGLGRHLLLDALRRTRRVAHDLGVCGMEVVALDEAARGFYLKYGFVPLSDDRLHLYLPSSVIRALAFPGG